MESILFQRNRWKFSCASLQLGGGLVPSPRLIRGVLRDLLDGQVVINTPVVKKKIQVSVDLITSAEKSSQSVLLTLLQARDQSHCACSRPREPGRSRVASSLPRYIQRRSPVGQVFIRDVLQKYCKSVLRAVCSDSMFKLKSQFVCYGIKNINFQLMWKEVEHK